MFDRYVAQQKPSWKRRAWMIASLVLHAVAGIVIVVWSFFHVEEIAPPAVSLTFFSAPPPPPPPPPPAKKKAESTPKVEPQKPVQPTEVPKIVQPKQEEQKPEETNEDDGVEGGEEGGVKGGEVGGVQGGVVGGVLGGTVGGTGTDPNAKGKMVAAFTLAKDQLSHPNPKLPDWYYEKNKGSTVKGMYKVCLRTDGHVADVSPMTPIPGVDAEVMAQIKSGWTYRPQPVPVCFAAVISFVIR